MTYLCMVQLYMLVACGDGHIGLYSCRVVRTLVTTSTAEPVNKCSLYYVLRCSRLKVPPPYSYCTAVLHCSTVYRLQLLEIVADCIRIIVNLLSGTRR